MHVRRSLAVIATVAAALGAGSVVAAATAAAGSTAATPKITFKADGDGWYAITATPTAPVKVTLAYGTDCDFVRGICASWKPLGTKLLPKGQTGRISWLQASFWGQTRKGDKLASGFYRLALVVPGRPASLVTTSWRLAFGD